jgi:hypothetical protein
VEGMSAPFQPHYNVGCKIGGFLSLKLWGGGGLVLVGKLRLHQAYIMVIKK